jgi:hypothetical protein
MGEQRERVRFLKNCAPYNRGELAGFPADVAAELIGRGVARRVSLDDLLAVVQPAAAGAVDDQPAEAKQEADQPAAAKPAAAKPAAAKPAGDPGAPPKQGG